MKKFELFFLGTLVLVASYNVLAGQLMCEKHYNNSILKEIQFSKNQERKIWKFFNPSLNEDFLLTMSDFGAEPKINSKFHGGEGQLFFSRSFPDLTLKRFFSKSGLNPWLGVEMLRQVYLGVEKNAEIGNYLEIAKVHDQGPDWIIRDFDSTSVPLKDVMYQAEVNQILLKIIPELQKAGSENYLNKVLDKIERRPPSVNVHWSVKKKKLLIFDMTSINFLNARSHESLI